MDAPFLHGQYDVSLDSKNRMLVPAEVRRRINTDLHGKDFFLVAGANRRPWLWCDKYYESLMKQQKSQRARPSDIVDYYRLMLGTAQQVELDAQNRILIPVRSMAWTGLQQIKQFYMVGVQDHLELWERADWEQERTKLHERAPELNDLVVEKSPTDDLSRFGF